MELYNDNTYRLNDAKGALEHLVKPIYDDLTLKKMYLIAEDTCFDIMKAQYNANNKTVIWQNKIMSVDDFREVIDTYRHAYINAIFTYKYGDNKTKFKANNLALADMSVKPYVQYGVSLQKRWGERFTGFMQTMIRNGGRNGVSLSAGFRWSLGK